MWMRAQDWGQMVQGKHAFRGAKWPSTDKVITLKSPADRAPRNMPLDVHTRIDDYFEKQFGVRFRSRSLFATGDPQIAAHSLGQVIARVALRSFDINQVTLQTHPQASLFKHLCQCGGL